MTNQANNETECLATILHEGFAAAESLQVGDVFQGSWGAASAAGYKAGTIEHDAFSRGFLLALDERVVLMDWEDEDSMGHQRIVGFRRTSE